VDFETISAERMPGGKGAFGNAQRWIVLLLASLLTAFPSENAAAQRIPANQFSAWAIGLPNGYVFMEHQTAAVTVTAADVARGETEVDGGTRIIVTLTEPSDIALDFRSSGSIFPAVAVRGPDRTVTFGGGGGTLLTRIAASGRCILSINYRFSIAPDTVPGTYAWPLAMAVRKPATVDLTRRNRIGDAIAAQGTAMIRAGPPRGE
jgi:hypothetical protein